MPVVPRSVCKVDETFYSAADEVSLIRAVEKDNQSPLKLSRRLPRKVQKDRQVVPQPNLYEKGINRADIVRSPKCI